MGIQPREENFTQPVAGDSFAQKPTKNHSTELSENIENSEMSGPIKEQVSPQLGPQSTDGGSGKISRPKLLSRITKPSGKDCLIILLIISVWVLLGAIAGFSNHMEAKGHLALLLCAAVITQCFVDCITFSTPTIKKVIVVLYRLVALGLGLAISNPFNL